MIYLYFADTSFLQNDVSFAQCKQFVSKDALQKAERYKNNVSRSQSLGATLLATLVGTMHATNNAQCKTFALENGGRASCVLEDKAQLAYRASGKPFFSNYPNFAISISHTKHLALCALAEQARAPLIGIDIELARRVPVALAKKCLTQKELNFVNAFNERAQNTDENFLPQNFNANFLLDSFEKRFLYLWTKKESYIKATGEGLALPLSCISFCPVQKNYDANNFTCAQNFSQDAFNVQNICEAKNFVSAQNNCNANNLHFVPFAPMQVLRNECKSKFFTQSYLLTGQNFNYGFVSLSAKLSTFDNAFDCTIKEINLSQCLGLH